MKEFWDYIAKNKYVFICVAIVVILYAFGAIDFLTRAVVLVALLVGAIYLGKKIQDNEDKIKDFFKGRKNKQEVYYYKEDNSKNK